MNSTLFKNLNYTLQKKKENLLGLLQGCLKKPGQLWFRDPLQSETAHNPILPLFLPTASIFRALQLEPWTRSELRKRVEQQSKSKQTKMSQFWKPGTEKPRIVDDEEGGVLFFSAAASSSSSSGFGYGSMEKQRQRLPVYKYRTAILYLVETHATTIIVGETGSGKTTQIPQVHFLCLCFLYYCYY